MKRLGLFLVVFLVSINVMFTQKQILVKNTLKIDRNAEMVELKICNKTADIFKNQFVLKNEAGKDISYQLIRNDKNEVTAMIFQADVKAKSSTVYSISAGKPTAVSFRTFARFVPERKDDFAWENDLAAYRMYGPALANENPSNGVDLWLKRTADTIVSKRYRDELQNGLTYHVDRGNGLDCYKVGHTLGAGGIAPYLNGKLLVGDHYSRFVIKENGPLRSVFTLYYDKVKVGSEIISQEITITTIAGTLLNKAEVKYIGKSETFELAAGIFTHDNKGAKHTNLKAGNIAYAEDAVSDAKIPSGRNYVGVFIPTKVSESKEQDNHLLLKANYKPESSFVYYFGGGWSKWKFETDKNWFDAVDKFSLTTKNPLKVTIK
jgi:hypothetical protein